MEPPDPSFADELSVPQEYSVLAFNVRRGAVSLTFQGHRLWMLLEAGLVASSNKCFEFVDKGPKDAQHGSPANLPKIVGGPLYGLSRAAVVGLYA